VRVSSTIFQLVEKNLEKNNTRLKENGLTLTRGGLLFGGERRRGGNK